ncbi:MFS transporter [Pseudomonas sp. LRF_L74]|uniref:MFS transporter n=1 Tax=Pseudomonas sp. LRF_L74 TaxID=3369422 RepID=UPI003F5EE412
MTRAEVRHRLSLEWWRYLGFAIAPLFLFCFLFGGGEAPLPVIEVPLFIAGMASMFITLPLFNAYKRSLIATGEALDTQEEASAWIELARRRRLGFLAAGLPAWIAAVAVFSGLNAAALVLLAFSSVAIFFLYRIPAQLG